MVKLDEARAFVFTELLELEKGAAADNDQGTQASRATGDSAECASCQEPKTMQGARTGT